MDWELSPSDGPAECVSPFTAYVYGVIIVLAVLITLGEWAGRRHRRTHDQRDEDYRSWIAAAILWPLLVSAIIFIVLWSVLTRKPRR